MKAWELAMKTMMSEQDSARHLACLRESGSAACICAEDQQSDCRRHHQQVLVAVGAPWWWDDGSSDKARGRNKNAPTMRTPSKSPVEAAGGRFGDDLMARPGSSKQGACVCSSICSRAQSGLLANSKVNEHVYAGQTGVDRAWIQDSSWGGRAGFSMEMNSNRSQKRSRQDGSTLETIR